MLLISCEYYQSEPHAFDAQEPSGLSWKKGGRRTKEEESGPAANDGQIGEGQTKEGSLAMQRNVINMK